MGHSVSRRNRRTASKGTIPAYVILIFCIAIIAFAGGAAGLAWALNTRAQPPDAPVQTARKPDIPDSTDSSYGDIIVADDEERTSSAHAADQTEQDVQEDTQGQGQEPEHEPGEPLPPEEPPERPVGQTEEEPEANDRVSAMPEGGQPAESESRSRIVHHDAFQEIPVYRTVHHQASLPKEVTIGGYTRIEWTSCPVCSQHHDAPYNERIVDHVSESHCRACGKRHAESYDEVLYY